MFRSPQPITTSSRVSPRLRSYTNRVPELCQKYDDDIRIYEETKIIGSESIPPNRIKNFSTVILSKHDIFRENICREVKVLGTNSKFWRKEHEWPSFLEASELVPRTVIDRIKEALRCVCLLWATEDNIDHTVDPSTHIRAGQIETAEWYGLVPFDSIVGTVQVLRSNIPIPPFTSQIPWPLHRFHINRFLVNKDQVLE
jgi:hypothetical protein